MLAQLELVAAVSSVAGQDRDISARQGDGPQATL